MLVVHLLKLFPIFRRSKRQRERLAREAAEATATAERSADSAKRIAAELKEKGGKIAELEAQRESAVPFAWFSALAPESHAAVAAALTRARGVDELRALGMELSPSGWLSLPLSPGRAGAQRQP